MYKRQVVVTIAWENRCWTLLVMMSVMMALFQGILLEIIGNSVKYLSVMYDGCENKCHVDG